MLYSLLAIRTRFSFRENNLVDVLHARASEKQACRFLKIHLLMLEAVLARMLPMIPTNCSRHLSPLWCQLSNAMLHYRFDLAAATRPHIDLLQRPRHIFFVQTFSRQCHIFQKNAYIYICIYLNIDKYCMCSEIKRLLWGSMFPRLLKFHESKKLEFGFWMCPYIRMTSFICTISPFTVSFFELYKKWRWKKRP